MVVDPAKVGGGGVRLFPAGFIQAKNAQLFAEILNSCYRFLLAGSNSASKRQRREEEGLRPLCTT
jgi:hypothetical protein